MTVIHLGRLLPNASSSLPGQSNAGVHLLQSNVLSLFGLAPSGVYPAIFVTKDAVRSYRTISPLPASWRYIFCGTFPGVTPGGR